MLCANPAFAEKPFWQVAVPGSDAHIPTYTYHHRQYPSWGERTHFGVDVWGKSGTPIVAVWDGVVEATITSLKKSNNDPETLGFAILVRYPKKGESGGDLCHVALHLRDAPTLSPGKPFKKGDELGKMGDTGAAKGVVHTHMELRNFCPPVRGDRASFFHSQIGTTYANYDARNEEWVISDWEDPKTFLVKNESEQNTIILTKDRNSNLAWDSGYCHFATKWYEVDRNNNAQLVRELDESEADPYPGNVKFCQSYGIPPQCLI